MEEQIAVSVKLNRHLVLLGMMGAGKSTLAKLIADSANCPLHSLDEIIEAKAGKGIPSIFASEGEAAFRAYESEALAQALQAKAGVIDTGGGIIDAKANRDLLVGSDTDRCFLATTLETLLERIGDGSGRPMLAGAQVKDRVTRLSQSRDRHYREVATFICEPSTGTDAAAVARQVATGLGL